MQVDWEWNSERNSRSLSFACGAMFTSIVWFAKGKKTLVGGFSPAPIQTAGRANLLDKRADYRDIQARTSKDRRQT